MSFWEAIVTTLLIVLIAAMLGIGSALYIQRDDGYIEQACEAVIDSELKLPPGTVDLTPDANKTTS
jgi:hypothetical protein